MTEIEQQEKQSQVSEQLQQLERAVGQLSDTFNCLSDRLARGVYDPPQPGNEKDVSVVEQLCPIATDIHTQVYIIDQLQRRMAHLKDVVEI